MEQVTDFVYETLKDLTSALVDKIKQAQTIEEAERTMTLLEKVLERLTERERQKGAKSITQSIEGR